MCVGTVWALWYTEGVLWGLFGVSLGLGSGETALLKKEVRCENERGVGSGVNEGRLLWKFLGLLRGVLWFGLRG